jgi:hypothetical protein
MLMALVVAVAGCASGPRYSDTSTSLATLAPTKVRLTIFREAHFAGSGVDARVKIDGRTVGKVPNGSVLVVEYEPGNLRIGLDARSQSDGMEFTLPTTAGENYYVEIRSTHADYMTNMGGVLPYVLGSMHAEGVTQHCGPGWCAALRSKGEALTKLADLDVETPAAN